MRCSSDIAMEGSVAETYLVAIDLGSTWGSGIFRYARRTSLGVSAVSASESSVARGYRAGMWARNSSPMAL